MSDSLTYPFDARRLLRRKIALRRELLAEGGPFVELKIAVLGGSTTNEVVDQMELFLLDKGIKPTFYQSEYGQFYEDAVFGCPQLEAFAPDIVYIHTNWRNIRAFPTTSSTREEAEDILQGEFARFRTVWEGLARFHCPVIQNNFDRPNYRLLGNKDISDYRGRSRMIARLNDLLADYADRHEGFFLNDIDYLAAAFGLHEWSNPLYWNLYKYFLSLEAIPSLAKSVSDIIGSIYGKNKKALCLDLDNTLWGGVVGDDGVEGIAVGPELPMGQIYREFQAYLKDLKSIGVLLTINSKNDEENALAGLNHPDGVLHPDDFVVIKANWENKDSNLAQIAKELNLGADSFVFADDNPAEREILRRSGLGAAVPEMTQVEDYIRVLDGGGYFEVTTLSSDDLARSQMYKENARRRQLEQSVGNYDEFLRSLEMKATIRPFEEFYLPRIAQLTNKSNQFNLTTLRCSEGDIARMASDPATLTLYGKLEDKFGDNGVVSVVAGEIAGEELHIRLWLMSCRVLKRGMEDAMLDALAADAAARGVKTLVGYYYPTAKNAMVKDFYARMGFTLREENERGSVWQLALDGYAPKNPHMEILR